MADEIAPLASPEPSSSKPTDAKEAPSSGASDSTKPAVAVSQSEVDEQFIDDLVAANRFKTFLVGGGAEVPLAVSKGISELVSKFADDIANFHPLRKPLIGNV